MDTRPTTEDPPGPTIQEYTAEFFFPFIVFLVTVAGCGFLWFTGVSASDLDLLETRRLALKDASGIIGVSVGIVVGGLGVASSLFIILWQSLVAEAFRLYLTLRSEVRDVRKEGRFTTSELENVEEYADRAFEIVKDLRRELIIARYLFAVPLLVPVGILTALGTVLLFFDRGYEYLVTGIGAVAAIGVAVLFFYLLWRLRMIKPIPEMARVQLGFASALQAAEKRCRGQKKGETTETC